jgi:hypothetical protein
LALNERWAFAQRQADLTAVLETIAERSPTGAAKVLAALDPRLRTHRATAAWATPVTGTPANRVKLVADYPYKMFSRIGAGAIAALHIRHAARRPWEGV